MSEERRLLIYLAVKGVFTLFFIALVIFSLQLISNPEGFVYSLNAGEITEFKGYYFYASLSFSYLILIAIISVIVAVDPIKYSHLILVITVASIFSGLSLIGMSSVEGGAVFVLFTLINLSVAAISIIVYFIVKKEFGGLGKSDREE
jgi:hypothetical protein